MGANWLTQSIYKPSIVRERNSVTADPQARKLNSCDRAAIGNTAFTFVLTCKGGGIYFRRMGAYSGDFRWPGESTTAFDCLTASSGDDLIQPMNFN